MADSDDEPMCNPQITPQTSRPRPSQLIRCLRTLSAHALDALKDFYTERDERAKNFEELKAAADERLKAANVQEAAQATAALASKLQYPLSMDIFGEDWNESQFWVRSSDPVFGVHAAGLTPLCSTPMPRPIPWPTSFSTAPPPRRELPS